MLRRRFPEEFGLLFCSRLAQFGLWLFPIDLAEYSLQHLFYAVKLKLESLGQALALVLASGFDDSKELRSFTTP
jgi:hypothetical protein